MRQQNLRRVKWDSGVMRAYVLRDEVRYWAPQETVCAVGENVFVLNPDLTSVTVKYAGVRETWRADATSPGSCG
jgi:hypothetical protein